MFKWFSVDSASRVFQYRCERCGKIHSGSPSFAYGEPVSYYTVPEAERAERVRLTEDTCVIDDEIFFVRGLLQLPIHDVDEPFAWGLWVSQSRESYERYIDTFDQDQSGDGSFGWLPVTIPTYADGDGGGERKSLPCNVVWQGGGNRPLIEPQPSDHPLYRDHVDGISWDRAIEMAQATMHG